MSAEFYAIIESVLFRVKVDRDGTMTFIDPPVDLEYELAFTAMGGQKTPALRLHDMWELDPITVITNHIPTENLVAENHTLSLTNLHLISLDWAEHTLYVYESNNPDRHRRVTAMLKEARAAWRSGRRGRKVWHVSKEIRKSTLDAISAYSVLAADSADHHDQSGDASPEFSSKLWGVWNSVAALSSALHKKPRQCAGRAATAFARHSGAAEASDEFYAAYNKEQSWQARRFVDVMSALQAGQPWPPPEATP